MPWHLISCFNTFMNCSYAIYNCMHIYSRTPSSYRIKEHRHTYYARHGEDVTFSSEMRTLYEFSERDNSKIEFHLPVSLRCFVFSGLPSRRCVSSRGSKVHFSRSRTRSTLHVMAKSVVRFKLLFHSAKISDESHSTAALRNLQLSRNIQSDTPSGDFIALKTPLTKSP